MALLRRDPDAKAAKQASEAKERARRDQKEFLGSPVGQARLAYAQGDHLFQYRFEASDAEPIIVAMAYEVVEQRSADAGVVLNAVCTEGWELVSGSFVFERRDDLGGGSTVGYYLFRRQAENRKSTSPVQRMVRFSLGPSQEHSD